MSEVASAMKTKKPGELTTAQRGPYSPIPRDGGTTPLWMQDAEAVNAAMELRTYAMNAAMNLLQIGRKLIEIKPRIDYGEWESFVESNTKMSIRTAQSYMQAYREFGFDGRIIELGGSQIIKLLPMSEDEREKLLTERDVKDMSIRDMDRAIKEIRKEEAERRKAEIEIERAKAREALEAERESGRIQLAKAREQAEAEKNAAVQQEYLQAKETVRKAWDDARAKVEEATARANLAEQRAFEAESRAPEIVRETVADPTLVEELRKSKEEIERLVEANRAMLESAREWSREKADMQAEIDENNDIIREQQGALNDAQNELLNLKSAQQRGMEPAGEEVTLDMVQRAVREFIGWVAPLPQMRTGFCQMEERERRKWREQVETVKAWAEDTMRAIDTVNAAEGGYSIA